MVTRHEFLTMLHESLKPRGYLEVGVFSGDSLRLVQRGTPAIGIDPAPHLHGHFPGSTRVFTMTSDDFFGQSEPEWQQDWFQHLDLAFIDGMHLFEYALRDFMNVERYSNPRTVVVFDDVLPRNQHEAAREQCPGDWTGDVWKVHLVLDRFRPDLATWLVDTSPTGTMVVWGLNPQHRWDEVALRHMEQDPLNQVTPVPEDVINRVGAISPDEALALVCEYLDNLEG